jgi:putative phosphoribosyl transferase
MKLARQFADRRAAGRVLASVLADKHLTAPVVLALPRGGVPVAAEIAAALRAPLDIVLVRKIGVPLQRELAVAAVVDGSAPEVVVNEDVATLAGVTGADIAADVKKELEEIERRRNVYLQGRARAPVEGRIVILVDDGIATGASVRAALRALKRKAPKALILAVPVAPSETVEALRDEVDEIVCLCTPDPFFAIGMHYADFRQVSDDEVVRCLAQHAGEFAFAAREKTTKAEYRGVAVLKS